MKQPSFLKKTTGILRHPWRGLLTGFTRNYMRDNNVLPDNFDWEFYLDFHSDLRQAGLRTRKDAIDHYTRHGFYEKRITRPQDKTLIDNYEATRLRQLRNINEYNEQCGISNPIEMSPAQIPGSVRP